ncbi:EcoKI restriction-modification system protein HsdS [archaeon BMS3Abin17]|nr:EcoKI restriction-modification system protein HsdS [archaeon BMS3Abin17]HDZ61278.1 restriction endonuclease subunit S [Candidatus Pacearchaeota archaeon]
MRQTKKLNEVAKVKSGFAFKSSEFAKQGIPIIRISNITNGQEVMILEKNQHYYDKELNEKIKNSVLKKDDILIALSGATTGKIGIYKESKPALLNQRIALIRSKDKKSEDYIYYFLQTKSQQILKEAYGGAQPNISPNTLKEYVIYYPEKFEDRQKIVSAIETQFTRLDEAIKSLKTVKQKIELYKKAVLKKAFENGKETELGKAFEIIMGQSPKSEYYNKEKKGLAFFQGKKEFNYKFPNIEIWTEKYNKEADKGDLLVSIRAPIGPCNISPEKCAIGRGIAAIKAKNETESLLLFYLINYYGQRLDSKGTGTTFKAISKNTLNSFIVTLPDKEDWEKIVSNIESKFSVIDKVEEVVDNSLKKAEMLRKSILKVAFEGKLVKNG